MRLTTEGRIAAQNEKMKVKLPEVPQRFCHSELSEAKRGICRALLGHGRFLTSIGMTGIPLTRRCQFGVSPASTFASGGRRSTVPAGIGNFGSRLSVGFSRCTRYQSPLSLSVRREISYIVSPRSRTL